MDNIERQALKDLFGSLSTAAADEARRRYTSKYHPRCCHVISTEELLLRVRQAFVEGVIWKETVDSEEQAKPVGQMV